jgi:putative sterol carrier protein
MTEPTRAFFKRLSEQHQPLLESLTGVVRFDIADGERTEHWYLQIRKGDVTVSHKESEADCVLSADIGTFDAILAGKMNAMAAVLRGALILEGKVILLTALQRLFPGTSEAPEKPQAGYARRQS